MPSAGSRNCEVRMMPDNYDIWKATDDLLEDKLDKRPKCDYCGEPIQEDSYHRVARVVICDRCLDDCVEYVDY